MEQWETFDNSTVKADVVIDFSQPDAAVAIIERCFKVGIPIVTGTTGWYTDIERVRSSCEKHQGTLFYAPNFSLGVNLFFVVNKFLAKTMSAFDDYSVSMTETHHIHKLDAPSGTAIKAAEGIIENHAKFVDWVNEPTNEEDKLPIYSERLGEVPGTHTITYSSEADIISLKHEAMNRSGFALGAVNAAEWVANKNGIFTMDDLIKSFI